MGYSANPFQAYIFKSWSFHSADIGWFGRCNHQPFLCFSALLIFKCKLDRRPSSMSSLTSSSSSSSVSSLSPVSLLSSSIDLRDNKSKRYVGGVEVKLCKPQLLFLPCIRWLRASFVRSETKLWPQRRIEKKIYCWLDIALKGNYLSICIHYLFLLIQRNMTHGVLCLCITVQGRFGSSY